MPIKNNGIQVMENLQVAIDTMESLLLNAKSKIESAKQSLENCPQGHNLQVVILNDAYTIGLTEDRKTKMNNHFTVQGVSIEDARLIKSQFKTKNFLNEVMTVREIRNARRFIKEKIVEAESQLVYFEGMYADFKVKNNLD